MGAALGRVTLYTKCIGPLQAFDSITNFTSGYLAHVARPRAVPRGFLRMELPSTGFKLAYFGASIATSQGMLSRFFSPPRIRQLRGLFYSALLLGGFVSAVNAGSIDYRPNCGSGYPILTNLPIDSCIGTTGAVPDSTNMTLEEVVRAAESTVYAWLARCKTTKSC